MLKQAIEFNTNILKIALNLQEHEITKALAFGYKVLITKKILIKAIVDNNFEFIKDLWINGHNVKSYYTNENHKSKK